MRYHLLASGSKGNAFVLENETTKLLIDCGTTKKYLVNSLNEIGVELNDLEGVLITHNHSDHTKQLKMFQNHAVYTPEKLDQDHILVEPYVGFTVGSFKVMPIPTSHDAETSVGYIIEDNEHKMVYVTDTGYVRNEDLKYMSHADIIVLESNHDPELLMATHRPYFIKQRILSDKGHLSNDSAGSVLRQIVSPKTQDIILAHLSLEANNDALAHSTVMGYLSGYQGSLRVGKQFEVISGFIRK